MYSTDAARRESFLPVLVANLFPFVGILALDWAVLDVLFVYWVELGVVIVLYSGLALFATREPRTENRAFDLPRVALPLSTRSGTVRPIGRLPPIYRRNVEFAAGTLLLGLGLWVFLAYGLLAIPSVGTIETLGTLLSVIGSAASPAALLNVAALTVSAVLDARTFLRQGRHEQVSAPMVLEIPCRRLFFWFGVASVGVFALVGVAIALVLVFDAPDLTPLGVPLLVVATRLAIEWGTYQAQTGEGTGRLARWVTPQEYDPE